MANLAKTMFREYDLRGRVNKTELNEDSMYIIGRAYASMLLRRGIKEAVLGYDYRSYSEKLTNAIQKGLLDSGINVINLGMIATPMMYASQYYYKTRGGTMVTASHNPNGWSGVKLALDYSHTLVPEEIKELYDLIVSEKFLNGHGESRKEDCYQKYFKDLSKRIKFGKSLKVVVNTANGGVGAYLPKMLKALGIEVIGLHLELNWNFPFYNPNPSEVEMMEDTGKKVREVGADLGIAIDADGDRLGITDEKGEIIWPDRYLILLARQMLEKYPGAKIVFDVKCSQALEEDIKNQGGVPIMWKTGHSYIKAKLWEEKAILAGEFSGHIFYNKPEYYGFDDAILATLKFLEYLSNQNQTLSQIIATTPYYISSPALQVDCADEVKYQVVDKLTKEFKNEGYEVIDINGARVKFGDGWGLVRASSNLPVLVLRFEAKTKERLEEIIKIFKEKFAKYPEIGKEWKSG
jgi:phosphomannomutase/phosphoglucomutase